MPFFRRERKQDEENLEWLYRNLQELDESETTDDGPEVQGTVDDGQKRTEAGDEGAAVVPDLSDTDLIAESAAPVVEAPIQPDVSLERGVAHNAVEHAPRSVENTHGAVENNSPADRGPENNVSAGNRSIDERRTNEMSENRREDVPFPNLAQQAPPRAERREPPATAETVVGRQSHFSGTFRSESDIRIEGTFEGEIDCSGTVTVAEKATLSATVRARNIVIAGSANGDIAVEERLHLRTSGELRGKTQAASFVVEEGALFEGEMKMGGGGQVGWQSVANGMSAEGLGSSVEASALQNDDIWEPTEQA